MNIQELSSGSGVRIVRPQWLSFERAVKQRGFSPHDSVEPILEKEIVLKAFQESFENFKEDPSPFVATQLLTSSSLLGLHVEAKAIAEYIVANPVVGDFCIARAKSVLAPIGSVESLMIPDEDDLRIYIKEKKRRLMEYPRDAISWLERARLYTLIGQKSKAENSIVIALRLAPTNRYVARSAVRFYMHNDMWDDAYGVSLLASRAAGSDPWIDSLVVSTSDEAGVSRKRLGVKLDMRKCENQSFDYSELAAAFATLECIDGDDRGAKKLFKMAWVEPSKSVVVHSDWVLREKFKNMAGVKINYAGNFEAMARFKFQQGDVSSSMILSRQWIMEEPYSSTGYMHASYLASVTEHYHESQMFAKDGLLANPNHHGLLNNRAFALAWTNDTLEAEKCLAPIMSNITAGKDIVSQATLGLIKMKKGEYEEGRNLYFKTIESASTNKDHVTALRAALNYVLTEMDCTKSVPVNVMKQIVEPLSRTSDIHSILPAQRICNKLKSSGDLTKLKIDDLIAAFDCSVAKANANLLSVNNQLNSIVLK